MHDFLVATSYSMQDHLENTQQPATEGMQVFNHTVLLCVSLIPALLFALGFCTDSFLPGAVIAVCIVVLKLKDNIQRTKSRKYTYRECVTMTVFTPM